MTSGVRISSPFHDLVWQKLSARRWNTMKAFCEDAGLKYRQFSHFMSGRPTGDTIRIAILTAFRDHLGISPETVAELHGCKADLTMLEKKVKVRQDAESTAPSQIDKWASQPAKIAGRRHRNQPALSPELAATARRVQELINFGHPWPGYGAQKPTGSFPSELRQIWDKLHRLDQRARRRCRCMPTPSWTLWRIVGYNRAASWSENDTDPVMGRLELAALRIALKSLSRSTDQKTHPHLQHCLAPGFSGS